MLQVNVKQEVESEYFNVILCFQKAIKSKLLSFHGVCTQAYLKACGPPPPPPPPPLP